VHWVISSWYIRRGIFSISGRMCLFLVFLAPVRKNDDGYRYLHTHRTGPLRFLCCCSVHLELSTRWHSTVRKYSHFQTLLENPSVQSSCAATSASVSSDLKGGAIQMCLSLLLLLLRARFAVYGAVAPLLFLCHSVVAFNVWLTRIVVGWRSHVLHGIVHRLSVGIRRRSAVSTLPQRWGVVAHYLQCLLQSLSQHVSRVSSRSAGRYAISSDSSLSNRICVYR